LTSTEARWIADNRVVVGDWGEEQIVAFHDGTGDTFLLDENGSAVLFALRTACGTLTSAEIASRVADPGAGENASVLQAVAENLAELERRALVHRVSV